MSVLRFISHSMTSLDQSIKWEHLTVNIRLRAFECDIFTNPETNSAEYLVLKGIVSDKLELLLVESLTVLIQKVNG